jgi:glyoxylase I family protein
MTEDLSRPRAPGLSHLGLSVSDLDRSIEFYRDVLNADVVRPPYSGQSPSFSGRMAIVMIGSLILDLYQHTENPGDAFTPTRTGLDHFALVASTQDELETWASWLDGQDVPRSPIRDAAGVGSIFDFTDPDGIQIEFYFLDSKQLRTPTTYSLRS